MQNASSHAYTSYPTDPLGNMPGAISHLPDISAPVLSELIGEIYDCALDPQRWPATCRKIADLCAGIGGGICVHDLQHQQNDQLFVFGYQPEFLQRLGSQYAQSPMAASDVVSNIGDVSALSMERHHLRGSRFFHEVLEPFGLLDMIWFPALRTGGRMASLHASRSVDSPHFQERDVGLFKLLSPHVNRALTISDALDIRTLRSEILEKTLDGLAAGVFLTTHDGRVVYMNQAAEQQVANGKSIRLVHQRVVPTNAAARTELSMAIEQASRDAANADVGPKSVAIPNGVSGGYVATLLPIASGLRHGMLAPFAASVAIFTQDPVLVPPMPGEAFARLHGLTGGELRVLMALSQGIAGTEVADMLGISEPTVRTHLQHIFSKTGTSRQADLLRMLHHSTPPIRTQATAPRIPANASALKTAAIV